MGPLALVITQTQWQCSQCTHWLTLQCTLVCTGTYTRVHWYYTLVDQCYYPAEPA